MKGWLASNGDIKCCRIQNGSLDAGFHSMRDVASPKAKLEQTNGGSCLQAQLPDIQLVGKEVILNARLTFRLVSRLSLMYAYIYSPSTLGHVPPLLPFDPLLESAES